MGKIVLIPIFQISVLISESQSNEIRDAMYSGHEFLVSALKVRIAAWPSMSAIKVSDSKSEKCCRHFKSVKSNSIC